MRRNFLQTCLIGMFMFFNQDEALAIESKERTPYCNILYKNVGRLWGGLGLVYNRTMYQARILKLSVSFQCNKSFSKLMP